ncbi:Threonine synthase [Moritella viscosa]|uniref:Threonine synthase n=1 Tax=Moritella viscosa TaxID=80854 RepID=A0A090IDW3_9GAMM|nr:threonine synthase [Moritella viscosa]CED58857.1 threonine synthase [Moritella viscosa]SGY84741.1 Threonine synthase [Moritella viscosa]SGY84804.1 Threonine synthase [Moritella viscosa]SGY85601.1 Threonine synthase [Moritella viscosa]SHN98184.1 Threonine synthase [Moritella viscosa]
MKLYSIKDHAETVSFAQAVKQGMGKNQGLFFPSEINPIDDIDALLEMNLVDRSRVILQSLIGDEFSEQELHDIIASAFNFPAPVTKISDKISALELFHGPTLAFKDFGGRFMAQCLSRLTTGEKITILTATSGDTGAAVAHAFYGIENIEVVVMYPKGKISFLQEQMFCTLGGNIRTIAIDGDFDACQALMKRSFDDAELRQAIGLNSANSINISRLMAQICYYFEAFAQLPKAQRAQTVVSVPSGNFGNLTAGLLAKTLGLPVKRFIAATNINDTVPRYLESGKWDPKATQATLSNAMDVSVPSNWPRIEELARVKGWDLSELASDFLSDEDTKQAVVALDEQSYLCEPHGAIAYDRLSAQLSEDEFGLFLCTAHPAKFKESVEEILGRDIGLPQELADCADKPNLSVDMANDFAALRAFLMA